MSTRSRSAAKTWEKGDDPAAKTWKKGDEAWVEFDAGTYKCELVSRNEYGYWTVKWANGDEDNKTVWEQKLGREAPQKRAKISVVCFVW